MSIAKNASEEQREARREYIRKRRAANREREREYERKWYAANRERERQRSREKARKRREANPEAAREYQREYYSRNKSYWRNWQEQNREKMRKATRANNRRRAAAKHGVAPKDAVAAGEYAEILRKNPCSYCGGPATAVDHIVPLSRGGMDDWDNWTAACKSCNSRKGVKSLLLSLVANFPANK